MGKREPDLVQSELRKAMRYQCSTTNCSTCSHSGGWNESNDKGVCNAVAGFLVNILRYGICKLHSAFNGGNLKRSIDRIERM